MRKGEITIVMKYWGSAKKNLSYFNKKSSNYGNATNTTSSMCKVIFSLLVCVIVTTDIF